MSDTDIGGYFAELKLITDNSSFDKGRKQLEDFTKAGERAVAIFSALQRITGGNGGQNWRYAGNNHGEFYQAQLGFSGAAGGSGYKPYPGGVVRQSDYIGGNQESWRYAGNNFGQRRMALPPGGGGDEGGGGGSGGGSEENKSDAKKSLITRTSLLYILTKAVKLLEDFTKQMWAITGSAARTINQSAPSAALMGMNLLQYNAWAGAFKASGQDFGGFSSGATDLENAYRNLRVGNPELYKKFAVPMAMLGLNIGNMEKMGNNERVQAIFNAAFAQKDPKKAIAALGMAGGDSWTMAFEWMKTHGMTNVGQFLAQGSGAAALATPSASQVAAAADFSKLQALMDSLKLFLGNVSLDEINKTVRDLNTWIVANKADIEEAFKALGGIFNLVLSFTGLMGKGVIKGLAAANRFGAAEDQLLSNAWNSVTGAFAPKYGLKDASADMYAAYQKSGRAAMPNITFNVVLRGSYTPDQMRDISEAMQRAAQNASGRPTQ